MKKLFASLMSLAMAVALVGCGGGDSTSSTTLRVGSGKDFANPDPAVVDDSVSANVLAQAYEGLYKLGKNGEVEPLLATALPEISKDGLTYTIKMKDGLKWSDGKALTAEDFAYSIKRAVTTDGYYTQFIYQFIKGAGKMTDKGWAAYKTMDELKNIAVKAVDATTLEIGLNEKCAYFTSLLTNTVFYPVQKEYFEANVKDVTKSTWALDTKYPTNGAFKVDSVSVKDKIILSKNPNYYAASEVKIEKIEFKNISDKDTQTTAFKSGELDFATNVNDKTIAKDEDLKKQVYNIDPFVCNYFILVNAGDENTNPALKDVNVRKAISYAIDRQAMLKVVDKGENAYELNGMIPVGIPGVNGDFREEADKAGKYATFDVTKAKELMEKAGYSETKRLKLEYSSNDNAMHKTVVQSLQESLKAAYIDLTYKPMEGEAYFDARDEGKFEIGRHAMTADFIDPMAYMSMYVGATTKGNTVDDKKYEDMVAAANKLDGKERLTKLHEAEKYLVEEQGYIIPLFGYSDPHLKSSKVDGITSSPEGHYNLTRAYFK